MARLSSLKDDNKAMEEITKDQALRLSQMDEEVARFKSSTAQLRYGSPPFPCCVSLRRLWWRHSQYLRCGH